MSYTISDLSYILYNNRSVNGVVKNFIPADIDPYKLIDIEDTLEHFRNVFDGQNFVEVDRKDVDELCDDVIVTIQDVEKLTDKIINAHKNLNGFELQYLLDRGISRNVIDQWKFGGLSNIIDRRDLEILNAICHPVLSPILEDGIEGGGILMPLFRDGVLVNCCIRKISDNGKLKSGVACPDVDVWGIDDVGESDVWITEGIFDMTALRSIGLKATTACGSLWSGIQLYKLIQMNPRSVTIFCDNDSVGLKSGFILHKFFNVMGIANKTVISKDFKDAADHIFKHNKGIMDIVDINITIDMIDSHKDNFDFLNYLKKRKF